VFKVELLFQAENELSDSYDWYEKQQIGLGDKFFNEINHYLNLLENNPYHFPVKYSDDLHSISVRKFPFLIIFWVDDINQTVFVVSVFHTSRNPQRL